MRLRSLQIILWVAATAAVLAFAAVRWWPATDDTQAAASVFTPAFALGGAWQGEVHVADVVEQGHWHPQSLAWDALPQRFQFVRSPQRAAAQA